MTTIQIELSDWEQHALKDVAMARGATPEEVIRDVVARALRDETDPQDWKHRILDGFGMWRECDDPPDFEEIRRSMDRNVWGEDRT